MSRTVPPYVHICICAYMYMYIYVYVHIYVYIYTHKHTHKYIIYIHVYTNSWKFIYSCVSLANEILRAVLSSERIFFLGRETDF